MGGGSSVVAAAINQEVAIASVVLYQALRPDRSLASLSALAPRTWLSTVPDPPESMHREQTEMEGCFSSKAGKEGWIIAITVNIKMSTFCYLIQIPHTSASARASAV